MENGNSYARLCPCAFGVAFGVLWSLSLVIMAVVSACCGDWGINFINLMSNIYIGYGTSFLGICAGLLWGLVDGFIAGFILAWLYNWVLGCSCAKCLCIKCKCGTNNTQQG